MKRTAEHLTFTR